MKDLFGNYPDRPGYAHGSDTSAAAADSLDDAALSRLRRLVYEFVCGRGERGATCDEIEQILQLRHQTASARLRELVLAGFIIDSNRRRSTRSKRNARVYVSLRIFGETA